MTRHLQRCRRCGPEWSHRDQRRGYTRHADRVCAACRVERPRPLIPTTSEEDDE